MSLIRPSCHHVESLLVKDIPDRSKVLFNLITASVQTALSFCLEFLPTTITIYFLGQTENETWISGYGLAFMWCQSFGFGILNGLACGLETLVAQAYGAEKFDLCGKLYWRALYVSTLLMGPISAFLLLSSTLLSLINGNKDLTDACFQFTSTIILAVYLNGIYVNTKVFLNGQNIYNFQMYVQAFTTCLSILLNYYLIPEYGLHGCALTRTIVELTNNVLMFSIVYITKCCSKTIIPFRVEHLKNSWKFLITAIPIGSILWFEWICYEFYAMQASYLSETLMSANVIMSNLVAAFYQVSYGVAIAATTFVGNEMGRKQIGYAKKYAKCALIIIGVFLLISQTAVQILRTSFCEFFTSKQEIVDSMVESLPLMSGMIVFDAYQGVLSGLVRGVGREKFAFITFIICYMFIGQTIAYLLCHQAGWKLLGIWVGMNAGAFLYDVTQIINLTSRNWSDLAEDIDRKITAQ